MKYGYIFWALFAILAIGVGLYPLSYLLSDMSTGLLGSKSKELLNSTVWNLGFYTHISFGGLALLVGWSQFSKKLRARRLGLHKALGKIYVISALMSSISGFYIAVFATGGIVSQVGFGTLAVLWLSATSIAYLTIRNKEVERHQNWMIRSYALCFAAVMLRLWLPLLTGAFEMEFISAYRMVAWLCWVPNLLVAELLVKRVTA